MDLPILKSLKQMWWVLERGVKSKKAPDNFSN